MTKTLFLIFAGLFPSVSVFSYMVLARDPATVPLAYAISKLIQLALPFIWVYGLRETWPRHWRWQKADVIEGAATGFAILLGLWALYAFILQQLPVVQAARPLIQEKVDAFGAGTPYRFLALCLFIAIAHSLFEEFYWRGFLHAELERRMRFLPALVLSSLGFTGHHIVVIAQYVEAGASAAWIVLLSSFVFVGGALWAWQYHRRQSLWGAWISHFYADVAILSLGYLLLFGQTV